MDMKTAQTSIYVNAAMQIFTDLTYSLLPISLLNDGRATREKVGICLMMAVGLLATSAAIYKTTVVNMFDVNGAFRS
jgi:rhodopsin domain-containing protein